MLAVPRMSAVGSVQGAANVDSQVVFFVVVISSYRVLQYPDIRRGGGLQNTHVPWIFLRVCGSWRC